MNESVRHGSAFLSVVWFQVATRVLETAIQVYNLTPEQAAALKKVFLRSGDYCVVAY